ncbi:hypothetical protein D9M68_894090 [compost metagenome]
MFTGSVRLAEASVAYRLSMLRPLALSMPGVTATGLAAARLSGEPMARFMARATFT